MKLPVEHLVAVLLCAVLTVTPAAGQTTNEVTPGDAARQSSTVTITTDVPGAEVFINGIASGRTPLTLDTLQPGVYRLAIAHPKGESWFVDTIQDSLAISDGENKTLSYTFEKRLLLTSDPFGAFVYAGDSLIGTTPLVLQAGAGSMRAELFLQKPGYERTRVDLRDHATPLTPIQLQRGMLSGPERDVLAGELYRPESAPLRLYLSGAGAILAGGAAAYFKVRADNAYADYRASANPALLSKTKRLDTAAAIALVATQVSLGLFSYFLLAE